MHLRETNISVLRTYTVTYSARRQKRKRNQGNRQRACDFVQKLWDLADELFNIEQC